MKKILIQIIYFLIIVVQLTACETTYMQVFQDINGFSAKKKGIIIIQTSFPSSVNQIQTEWKNINIEKYFNIQSTSSPQSLFSLNNKDNSFIDDTMIYFIEPGEYTLTNLSVMNKRVKLSKDILKFNVEAGKVIYIGKIVANSKFVFAIEAIDIEDDYDKAKIYFKNRYPQITQIVEKRLAYFTPHVQAFKTKNENKN